MPLLVALTEQDAPGELVNSSNVHLYCQHEIARLKITLTNRQKDESFALSYILGHTTKIKRLWIEGGTALTITKLLLQLDRHRETCCLEELDVTSGTIDNADCCWDNDATKLLNRICLDSKNKSCPSSPPLRRLGLGQRQTIDITGINLSTLTELRLPLVDESTMLDVANSLHAECRLSSIKINGIHLSSKLSPAVLEALCDKLSLLQHLKRLSIVIYESTPDNIARLAQSLPASLQSLTVYWCGSPKDMEDLAHFRACMPSLKHFDISFGSSSPASRSNRQPADVILNTVMVSLLNSTKKLQHLSIGPLRKSKQHLLPFLQALSTDSMTTLKTVVFGFVLVFDAPKRNDPSASTYKNLCAQSLYDILQHNRQLRHFAIPPLALKEPKSFRSTFTHLLRLNQVRFRTEILPGTIPLALLPRVLEGQQHSVLYDILRQKNDVLVR